MVLFILAAPPLILLSGWPAPVQAGLVLVDVVSVVMAADFVERPAGGVLELPVDVALAGDVGALVAATHGDDEGGRLHVVLVELERHVAADIDANLAHRLDDRRVDVLRRAAAR